MESVTVFEDSESISKSMLEQLFSGGFPDKFEVLVNIVKGLCLLYIGSSGELNLLFLDEKN